MKKGAIPGAFFIDAKPQLHFLHIPI